MKNRYLILLVALVIGFTGCDKDLDLSPLDTVSDGTFWKVPSDFEKAATEFYHSLGNAGNGGKDRDSDITVGNSPNTISSGTYVAGQSSGTWNNNYGMIRATTKLVEKSEAATDIQDEIKRYAGEAKFFRARAYFSLVSTFGDVPLIKRVLDIDSEELDAPRASRADVMAYIFEDLDWAITNLPEESALPAKEKGRATKGAALALKSKIALFEGTWSKYHGTTGTMDYFGLSISAAQQLISSGEYGLYEHANGPTASYYNLFIEGGQGSAESILARKYSEELNIKHNTTRWVETHHNSPTKKLADMYVCTDGLPIDISPLFQGYDLRVSEFENRDPRMNQTIMIPGSTVTWAGSDRVYDVIIGGGNNGPTKSGYLAFKFQSDSESAAGGNSLYDYMELRYAEVLLNLAEALYEKNAAISDGELDQTINKLRDRVGVAHLTNALVTSNSLNMLNEIRRERTVELAYEGFRLYDLRRWKTAVSELSGSLLGVKFEGTEWPTIAPNDNIVIGVDVQVNAGGFIIGDDASTRQFADKHYLFPLPLDQIQLNSNLAPNNPGW